MKLAPGGVIYGSICFVLTVFVGYMLGSGSWVGLAISAAVGCVLFGICVYAYGTKDEVVSDGWVTGEDRGGLYEKDRGQLPRGGYERGNQGMW
jgi:hypothetical protein